MEKFSRGIENKIRRRYNRFNVEMKFLIRNKNPDGVADLLNRISKHPDLVQVDFAAGRHRRYILTDAIGSELPSVITTLEHVVFEPTL